MRGVEQRVLQGTPTQMLVLESEQHRMRIHVPITELENVGLREVIGGDTLEQIRGVLAEDFIEEPTNWSRRFKSYEQKLSSGSIVGLAEVVRDLTRRSAERSISAGEKRMLESSRTHLCSELALVPEIGGGAEAQAYLDAAIRGEQ